MNENKIEIENENENENENNTNENIPKSDKKERTARPRARRDLSSPKNEASRGAADAQKITQEQVQEWDSEIDVIPAFDDMIAEKKNKEKESIVRENAAKTPAESDGKSKNQKKSQKKGRRAAKILGRIALCIFTIILLVLAAAYTVFAVGFNGPSPTARAKLAKSLIETSAMKWVPGLFLSQNEIDTILKSYETEYFNPEKEDESEIRIEGTTVSFDMGSGIVISLNESPDDGTLTVNEVRMNGNGFGGSEALADIQEKTKDKNIAEACKILLCSLRDGGFIPTIPSDDDFTEVEAQEILVCTISENTKAQETILSSFTSSLKELSLAATIHGVFVSQIDEELLNAASDTGITYGKAYFAKMVSESSISLSAKRLFSLSIKEIVALSNKDGVDITALVDFHNDEQSAQADKKKQPEEDEWADCPDGIRIETIRGGTYVAHIMIIRDPSRLFVATSAATYSPEVSGKRIAPVMQTEGAIAGINGGYFVDQYPYTDHETGKSYTRSDMSTGQIPIGIVISKGNIVWSGSSVDRGSVYKEFGFVGITNDNKLILTREKLSTSEALARNVRDGVCGGPILIDNGATADYKNASGEAGSLNPRTVIGQREDGAIIFLCVDGRMANSLGASYADLVDIMVEYKAVNAACLDGGSSSIMYYKDSLGKYGTAGELVRINTYNALQANPRRIPTFFMISE